MADELAALDATAQAARVADGDVSAKEMREAAIARWSRWFGEPIGQDEIEPVNRTLAQLGRQMTAAA